MLKELREAFNLTQDQLASEVGVDRTMISHIENGKARPSVNLAKKLGTKLNVEWSIFFKDGSENDSHGMEEVI